MRQEELLDAMMDVNDMLTLMMIKIVCLGKVWLLLICKYCHLDINILVQILRRQWPQNIDQTLRL